MDHFFSIVAGEGPSTPRKPDLQSYLKILQRLKVSVTQAVMVGDGPADLRLDPGTGVFRILVTWGFNDPARMVQWDPDAICDTPGDLPRFIL